MVVSRPFGDRKPSEHLHALRLEFGEYPNNTSLLRRIFEDSLHTNIATLLAVEHIVDIDALAARADELYVTYPPTAVNLAQQVAPAAGTAAALRNSYYQQSHAGGLVRGYSSVSAGGKQ